jgi:hypothetical protein
MLPIFFTALCVSFKVQEVREGTRAGDDKDAESAAVEPPVHKTKGTKKQMSKKARAERQKKASTSSSLRDHKKVKAVERRGSDTRPGGSMKRSGSWKLEEEAAAMFETETGGAAEITTDSRVELTRAAVPLHAKGGDNSVISSGGSDRSRATSPPETQAEPLPGRDDPRAEDAEQTVDEARDDDLEINEEQEEEQQEEERVAPPLQTMPPPPTTTTTTTTAATVETNCTNTTKDIANQNASAVGKPREEEGARSGEEAKDGVLRADDNSEEQENSKVEKTAGAFAEGDIVETLCGEEGQDERWMPARISEIIFDYEVMYDKDKGPAIDG